MIDQRFSLDELGDAVGSELTDALQMGRQLEASIERIGLSLPARDTGFDVATAASGELGDRVMAALANEPAPATTGFLLPLRRFGVVRGLRVSVRQAWVGLGGAGRPLLARGAALAYVLVIALAGVSVTGAATAGALGLLGPLPATTPEPTVPPQNTPPPTTPAPQSVPPTIPTPAPSTVAPPEATPSPTPFESPDESDDSGGNSGPGGGDDDDSNPGSDDETPEPSRDHGTPEPESSDDDSSGPGGSGDDSSGSSSGSDLGSGSEDPASGPGYDSSGPG